MAKTTWIQVSASSRLTVGPIPVRSRNRFIFDKLKNNPENQFKKLVNSPDQTLLAKITERKRHCNKNDDKEANNNKKNDNHDNNN